MTCMARGSLVGDKVYSFSTLFFISQSPIHRMSNSFKSLYERLFFSVVLCVRLNMEKETNPGEQAWEMSECFMLISQLIQPDFCAQRVRSCRVGRALSHPDSERSHTKGHGVPRAFSSLTLSVLFRG